MCFPVIFILLPFFYQFSSLFTCMLCKKMFTSLRDHSMVFKDVKPTESIISHSFCSSFLFQFALRAASLSRFLHGFFSPFPLLPYTCKTCMRTTTPSLRLVCTEVCLLLASDDLSSLPYPSCWNECGLLGQRFQNKSGWQCDSCLSYTKAAQLAAIGMLVLCAVVT